MWFESFSSPAAAPLPVHRSMRTISGSKSEDHLITTESGRVCSFTHLLMFVITSSYLIISIFILSARSFAILDKLQRIYTKGRPPWYDREGKILKQPYVVGICGGSASGKTTVARRIIERLEVPWVTVLSMDSFYKVFFSNRIFYISNLHFTFQW